MLEIYPRFDPWSPKKDFFFEKKGSVSILRIMFSSFSESFIKIVRAVTEISTLTDRHRKYNAFVTHRPSICDNEKDCDLEYRYTVRQTDGDGFTSPRRGEP